MVRGTYRCGKCGQLGHNRQSCGMAPPQGKTILPSLGETTREGDARRISGGRGSDNGGVVESFVRAGNLTDLEMAEKGEIGSDVQVGESSADGFELEELEVWWELVGSGGRNGRWEDRGPEQLANFLTGALQSGVGVETVEKFFRTFKVRQRVNVAVKAELSGQMLAILLDDPAAQVREVTVGRENVSVPVEALLRLARDKDVSVRVKVLREDCPPEVVGVLYDGLGDDMRIRRGEPYRVADLRCIVLVDENLDAGRMREALSSSQEKVVAETLENPNVTEEDVERVWRQWEVVRSAGENYNDDERVSVAVMGNPRTPARILVEHSRFMLGTVQSGGEWDYPGLLRFAGNPNCPPEELDRVVCALIKNRNDSHRQEESMTIRTMRKIAKNPVVRQVTLDRIRAYT